MVSENNNARSITNLFSLRGECYYRLGQFEDVIQDFDAVITLDPNYMWRGSSMKRAKITVAQSMYKNKDYRGAVNILDVVIKQIPSDMEILWLSCSCTDH